MIENNGHRHIHDLVGVVDLVEAEGKSNRGEGYNEGNIDLLGLEELLNVAAIALGRRVHMSGG